MVVVGGGTDGLWGEALGTPLSTQPGERREQYSPGTVSGPQTTEGKPASLHLSSRTPAGEDAQHRPVGACP